MSRQRLAGRLVGLTFALGLAASACLFMPRPASALPASSSECEYYSDATYTTQVGYRYISCNGQTTRWGVTTSYSICTVDRC